MSSDDNHPNSLYPDQARQYVEPDLDPNCLTPTGFLKEVFVKDYFEEKKITRRQHIMGNCAVGKE